MKSIQDRILERIAYLAYTEVGVEVTQAQEWGNTGHLIFTRVEQFEPLCDLRYDIQTHYANFEWRTDGVPITHAGEEVKRAYVEYARTGSVTKFLRRLEEDLSARLALGEA